MNYEMLGSATYDTVGAWNYNYLLNNVRSFAILNYGIGNSKQNAILQANNMGVSPVNRLETIKAWQGMHVGNPGEIFVAFTVPWSSKYRTAAFSKAFGFDVGKIYYIPLANYFQILSNLRSGAATPREFSDWIDALKLAELAGLSFKKYYDAEGASFQYQGYSETSIADTHLINKPIGSYLLEAGRFREKIDSLFTTAAFACNQVSTLEDVLTVFNDSRSMLNQFNPDSKESSIIASIDSLIPVAITFSEIRDYSGGPNPKITTGFNDKQFITMGLPDISECAIGFDPLVKAFKDMYWESYKRLLKGPMLNMFARLAQLKDPKAYVNIIPGVTDKPWNNPFLVFNEEKSRIAGYPVYDNTAQSVARLETPSTVSFPDPSKQWIPVSYYEQATKLMSDSLRINVTDAGLPISPGEQRGGTPGAQSSLLPWLLVGAAGIATYLSVK